MPNEPLCEVCSTRRASLRITALRVGSLNGRTFVCTRCALEDKRFRTAGGFDLAAFVFSAAGKQSGHSSRIGCPECGTSLAEVVTGGRMGCAVCYDRFASEIESALLSIHGASVHRGKMPE
jgi:protein arginine kinase activator